MKNYLKSLILSLAFVFGAVAVNAQSADQLKSKNGTPILPEAGDYSIGVNAVPVLNYFGNLMNSSGNTFAVGYQQAGVITGSYMKTANSAYRGKLAISLVNSTVDSTKTQSSGVTLGLGKMTYRGKGRLQGYYGYEAGLGFSNGKVTVSGVETKAPNTFGLNARGFVGTQYFFAPKMSIGAEYGWGLGFSKSGDNSSFNVGVDNAGGSIYLSLFF